MTGTWSRPLTLGVVVFGLIYGLASATGHVPWPGDAQCYYLAQGTPLYGVGWLSGPCFSYSPAFAQAMTPLQALPWEAFVVLWETALFGALALAIGPLGLVVIAGGLVATAFPVLVPLGWPFADIAMGNVQAVIALVCVAGFRHSWAWSFVLLSKVTPAVGLLWYVGARQWRALAVPLVASVIVAGVSFALAPNLWSDWFGLLASRNAQAFPLWTFPVSLPVRLAMSAALALWGGATGRRWTMPLAAGWALPAAYGTLVLVWLAAIPLIAQLSRSSASRTVTTSLSPSASALR